MDAKEQKPTEEQAAAGAGQQEAATQSVPVDALSKSNEELNEVAAANPEANKDTTPEEPVKKLSPLKAFWRKVNIYFLGFILLAIIAGAVAAVSFLNSRKEPPAPSIATQELTQDALKQLANSDASIGNAAQTLTVQGNANFAGAVLVRSDLNVAADIQLGGQLLAPSLTVSGTSNLAQVQINTLQVANGAVVQGVTTLKDLNVSGTSSFSGPVTAGQITASRIILTGNAVLQVPNHLAFTGPPASRASFDGGIVGSGGSASVSGSDTSGTINVNTGNGPSSGCFIGVRFAQAFSAAPRVIISPVNAAAGASNYYVTKSATGFSVCTGNTLQANQNFSYDYFVVAVN